ncbi:ABC transporter permease [Aquipuribacter hungaricus]|uniref:ABC transporter permease n=1 Tax=Aquipuribacter hungaricus TaxID=545624 RepID=A0ABV7WNB6_9MICO
MSLSTSEKVALQRVAGVEGVAPSGWVQPGAAPGDGATSPGGPAPRSRGGWGRRGLRDLGLGLVLPVVLLGLWQVLVTAEVLDPSRFSSPAALGAELVAAVESGRLWPNLAISAQRVFLGFGIGALLAVLTGLLVALSRTADRLVSPLLGAVRAVPSLAWVSVLILWFGIGEENKVGLVAIGAFFPVLATLVAGIRQVDRGLLEVAQAYGLSWRQRVTTVLLPSAAPSLLAGARLGLNQAWLFLVAAELLGATSGLGWQLQNAQRNGQIELVLVTIILFAVIGKLTDSVLAAVETTVLARLS